MHELFRATSVSEQAAEHRHSSTKDGGGRGTARPPPSPDRRALVPTRGAHSTTTARPWPPSGRSPAISRGPELACGALLRFEVAVENLLLDAYEIESGPHTIL